MASSWQVLAENGAEQREGGKFLGQWQPVLQAVGAGRGLPGPWVMRGLSGAGLHQGDRRGGGVRASARGLDGDAEAVPGPDAACEHGGGGA